MQYRYSVPVVVLVRTKTTPRNSSCLHSRHEVSHEADSTLPLPKALPMRVVHRAAACTMRAIGSRTVTVRVVRDPPPRVGAHVLEPELRLPPCGARTEMHAEMHAEMRARDGTRRAPISRSARLASPYTVATSPGRRAAISCLSSLPHACGDRAEIGRRSGGGRAEIAPSRKPSTYRALSIRRRCRGCT